MPSFTIQQCAIPAVTFLICLIAYPSLWLLRRLGPQPLTQRQTIILHVYAVVIIYCYYKACFTDPGRIPKDWVPKQSESVRGKNSEEERQRQRWCRKCQAFKPPRAHHCKTCERFVASWNIADLVSHLTIQGVSPRWITTGRSYPCLFNQHRSYSPSPWTANCVSHTTFPHFVRFLFYAVSGMSHLECLLGSRMYHLWTQSDLPSVCCLCAATSAIISLLF